MSLTYNTYVSTLGVMMGGINTSSGNFTTILPDMIDYAELRCYRDLDIQAARVTDNSATLTASSRNFTLPQAQGRFVVVEDMAVYTPVATTTKRNPLLPASRSTVTNLWPSDTPSLAPSVPEFYAPITDQIFLLGPPPDATYAVEVRGMIRPASIASGNQTTPLSLYWPDLLLAASMIFAAGYQKNFGAQADDPKMAQSWEAQYKTLLESALKEEWRKKFVGDAWTSQAQTPIAQPPRS